MRIFIWLVISFGLFATSITRAEDEKLFCTTSKFVVPAEGVCAPNFKCEGNPHLVGPCTDVRGRIDWWERRPPVMWIVGTKRTLWLAHSKGQTDIGLPVIPDKHPDLATERDFLSYMPLPARIANLVDGHTLIFGNFRVCPLEPLKPGLTQEACVERASNIRLEEVKGLCEDCGSRRKRLPDSAFEGVPE